MKNDPCDTATTYAEEMSACADLTALAAISARIKANLAAVAGWEQWLRDWHSTCYKCLTMKEKPDSEVYNKEGLAWLAKNKLANEKEV